MPTDAPTGDLTSDLTDQISGVSLLADPVRRRLYDVVTASPDAVGRVEAAQAAGVPAHTAKFHLDKLVEEGLLTTEFRRLTGRSGPGAGRPAKLYRRSDRQLDLTLPRRQYELAGHLLATAVEVAAAQAVPVLDAVRRTAHDAGRQLVAGPPPPGADDLDTVAQALRGYGYEPRRDGDRVLLANCPFDRLAAEHRTLVCTMNLALVEGVVEQLHCAGACPALDPAPGRCCVTLTPSATAPDTPRR
ncbi:MAG: helix-turn-helix transcriptional regulator [Angustibacter sp.]